MTKPEMRRLIQATLRGISDIGLETRSRRVTDLLLATEAWVRADTLLCFLSMPHEIDTTLMLKAAQEKPRPIAVPRIEGERIRFLLLPPDLAELPRDRFGIPVPGESWHALDAGRAGRILVITPGLAFDRAGNRLGRGKGYYDRFLSECRFSAPARLTALGVCFNEQLVDEVPHGPDDQRVDGVVTESETILIRP